MPSSRRGHHPTSSSSVFGVQRERPFEEFFVARKAGRSLNISSCFPGPAHRLNQKFPNVVLFCFPDRAKLTGQNAPPPTALRFTFVLTNEFGERLFGHSLHLLHGDLICFISKYCWIRFFDEVLYRYRMNGNSIDEVISFYNSQVPLSMGTFHTSVVDHQQQSSASASASASSTSSSSSVLSIAEGLRRPNDSGNAFADVRLAKALEFLSNDVLLQVIAALMCEARVVIVGQRVAHISDVVLAVVALLQPFDWQHVLIPILPNDLLDVLCSPTPFLIGLLAGQIPSAARLPAEDTVVVVLGRDGGEGSYVRKGIPSFIPTQMDVFPDAGMSAPVAERTQQEIEERLEAEQLYGPILRLPFTDSSLCSLRVGLYQARRHHSNRDESDADRALLAAFHDYYVFTFGLIFAGDFTPQNFTTRMVAKTEKGETQAASFFERVSDGMMLNELRARKVGDLEEADSAALEMKKRQPHMLSSVQGFGKTSTTDLPVESARVQSFRPSPSDVFHIRRILRSEFLEAVLERYPLLYPHAAQVLAYGSDSEEALNDGVRKLSSSSSSIAKNNSDGSRAKSFFNNNKDGGTSSFGENGSPPSPRRNDNSTNSSSRTVPPLEAADILRKFASWCSYGFTSTVQKLTTSGKNVDQTRAELEEL